MNRHIFKILAPCLVPAVALCLAGAARSQSPAPASAAGTMPMSQPQHAAAGSADMKQSMAGGMEKMQKMPMTGDVDKDFAMMMKLHHQGAIDMAQMQLAHGKSKEMKAMATKIIADQKKEIAEFDRWLAVQK